MNGHSQRILYIFCLTLILVNLNAQVHERFSYASIGSILNEMQLAELSNSGQKTVVDSFLLELLDAQSHYYGYHLHNPTITERKVNVNQRAQKYLSDKDYRCFLGYWEFEVNRNKENWEHHAVLSKNAIVETQNILDSSFISDENHLTQLSNYIWEDLNEASKNNLRELTHQYSQYIDSYYETKNSAYSKFMAPEFKDIKELYDFL